MSQNAPDIAQIGAGPRTLRLMPADQQAGLDPFMGQIVTYRESGLSLDHIVGCPLDCGYRVRHFWGTFEVKTPQLLAGTEEVVELLTMHPGFRFAAGPTGTPCPQWCPVAAAQPLVVAGPVPHRA